MSDDDLQDEMTGDAIAPSDPVPRWEKPTYKGHRRLEVRILPGRSSGSSMARASVEYTSFSDLHGTGYGDRSAGEDRLEMMTEPTIR